MYTYSSITYGDAWNVINVFDGDEDTNVVCEGYSKAFQYLCDMSDFDEAECYTVSGTLTGAFNAGSHMWNIVYLDGENRVADITNSDTGTAGANEELFLVSVGDASESSAEGYTFEISGTTVGYTYNEKTLTLYDSSILTLGPREGEETHTLVYHEAVAATCTTEGNIEYWTCEDCDKVFADEDGETEISLSDTVLAVDATNHSGELVVKDASDATCSTEGYTGDVYCSDCGEIVEYGEAIPMGEHSLVHHEAVAATCTKEGNTEYWECSECGKVFADENGMEEITLEDTALAVDPDNHSGYYETRHVVDATCTEEGYTGDVYCTDCDGLVTEGEAIPMLDHNLTHYEAVDATCTTEGNIEYWVCSECGKVFANEDCTEEISLAETILAVDKTNHTGDMVVKDASDATCSAEGYTGDTYCTDCGEIVEYGEAIGKLDHELIHYEAVEATCVTTGQVEHWTCSECGTIFLDKDCTVEANLDETILAVDPENHTGDNEIRNAAEPTYTSEGYTGDVYCSGCGELLESGETIAKLEHTMVHHEAVAATCTTEGSIEYWTCEDCNLIFADVYGETEITLEDTVLTVDSTNHSGELIVKDAYDATCTTEGYSGDTYCSDCGQLVETGETIPVLAHDLTHYDAVEATCTTEGNIEYWVCSECGKVFADEDCTEEITLDDTITTVDAANHTGDLEVRDAVEATCTSDGYTGDTYCKDCGEIVEAGETIPMTDHITTHYDAVAATCTTEGNIEYWICSECGRVFADEDCTEEITLDDTILAADTANHTGELEIRDASNATCTADGYTGDVYCTDCGKIVEYGETIEKTGHDLTHYEAVEATCVATGQAEYWTCANCGKVFLDEDCTNETTLEKTILAVDPDNHTGDTEIRNAVEPTYTSEGYTGDVYCTDCGELIETGEVITKLEHTFVHHEAVEATCATEGSIEYWTCEDCNLIFADAYGETEITLEDTIVAVDSTNHTGNLIVKDAVEAACTADGYTGDTYCSDCGELVEEGEVIPAAGHTLVYHEAVEATSTEDGNTEYWVCSVCGKVFSDEDGEAEITIEDTVIPATGSGEDASNPDDSKKDDMDTGSSSHSNPVCSAVKTVVKVVVVVVKSVFCRK